MSDKTLEGNIEIQQFLERGEVQGAYLNKIKAIKAKQQNLQ